MRSYWANWIAWRIISCGSVVPDSAMICRIFKTDFVHACAASAGLTACLRLPCSGKLDSHSDSRVRLPRLPLCHGVGSLPEELPATLPGGAAVSPGGAASSCSLGALPDHCHHASSAEPSQPGSHGAVGWSAGGLGWRAWISWTVTHFQSVYAASPCLRHQMPGPCPSGTSANVNEQS